MSKIIKLKQSDLKKVIDKVLKEQSQEPEAENIGSESKYGVGKKLTLGKDDDGNFYVFDENGDIVEKV
jgi:hypothetical protein